MVFFRVPRYNKMIYPVEYTVVEPTMRQAIYVVREGYLEPDSDVVGCPSLMRARLTPDPMTQDADGVTT